MAEQPDAVTEALNATEPPDAAERSPGRFTAEWQPGYTLNGETGELTTSEIPDGQDPDWSSIFAMWGLSPDEWAVVDGSLRVNAWQMHGPDGELRIHRQYKATIRRRTVRPVDGWSTDEVLLKLAKWRPVRRKRPESTGEAWVVSAADWQIGGRPNFASFEERFTAAMDDLVDRAKDYRKEGITDLVVGFLGDMAEGVGGNYPAQAWEVDLDRDDQTRLVAGFELTLLRELAPMFASTTAVAIPGNHSRTGADYATGEHDVADMTSFKWAASMLRYAGEAERWGIKFVVPDKHRIDGAMFARVNAAGTRLLFAHGHKTRGGADRLRKWWQDVSFSRWGDADATDHLVTGHRHHAHIEECSRDRWLFVSPTLGGPSTWFHDGGGPTSRHGMLHYVTRNASVQHLDIAGAYTDEGTG